MKGIRGVFLCYALPALDKEIGEFTEAAGTARWYLYDLDRDNNLEEPGEIVAHIRSAPDTPRHCAMEKKSLIEIKAKVVNGGVKMYRRGGVKMYCGLGGILSP